MKTIILNDKNKVLILFPYLSYFRSNKKTVFRAKEALAIRCVFSLVGMIRNTKFSNCTLVFKIGAIQQQNMQSKHQNTFQSNLSLAKQ